MLERGGDDDRGMTATAPASDPLIRIADLLRMGANDRRVRQNAVDRKVVRLVRGTFVPAEVWSTLTHDQRYLLRIRAVAETLGDGAVLSHYSAAAVWGYPIIGLWPELVHVIVGAKSGCRSSSRVVRHVVDVDYTELRVVDGLTVTSPLRTLCDLARMTSFESAVAAFDQELRAGPPAVPQRRPLERWQIMERLAPEAGGRGVRNASAAASFADASSGSAGESFSRVQIHRLRMPQPELQVPIVDHLGREWHTDFGWEGAFGEFDGRFKYSRNRFTKGRPPEEIVWEEKRREDAIRAASGRGMVRWVWDDARNLIRFERILRGSGIRPVGER